MALIWMFVLVLSAAWPRHCIAQNCSPYWAKVDISSIPGNSQQIIYEAHDDGDGPRLYALSNDFGTIPPDVWRWDGKAWASLGRPSVASSWYAAGILSIDDGNGPGLYVLISSQGVPFSTTRYSASASPVYTCFRYMSSSWVLQPYAFWNSARLDMGVTGDVGHGRRFYAVPTTFRGVGEYQGNGVWKNTGNLDGEPARLVAFNDGNGPALYALGYFGSIGGTTYGGFAKYDGERWSNPWPPPISIGNGGRCAVVFDDGTGPAIYANLRPQIGGIMRNGIHRWTAEGWELVFEYPSSTQIHDMKIFDDGRGPALYLSGLFTSLGGVAVRNIARWDGHTIEPLDAGLGGLSRQMLVIETARGRALFARTGTTAGGGTVQRAAIWVGCPNCYADCNLDGQLTVADFSCFTAKVSQNDPYANCTVDGQIDVADYICFISKFAAGCP